MEKIMDIISGFVGCLLVLIWIVGLIMPFIVIILEIAECFLPTDKFDAIDGLHALFFVIVIILILMYYYSRKHRKELETKFDAERWERNNLEDLLKKERNQFENSLKLEQIKYSALVKKNNELRNTISSRAPFKFVAELTRDCFSAIFDREEHYLRYKSRPATKSADVVKELKAKYNQMGELYLNILYKYNFLLNVFPELGKYVDDDQELLDLADYEDMDDLQQNYDRVKDYVSDEEYRNLSIDERNQRALDNWRRRRKPSSAAAGMEYELYCAYLLREEGFNVIEHGVLNGRKDQGIDLIAQKPGITYIVQCKRYSTAFVHENTVCQLFGTTLNYTLANKEDWDKTLFGYTDDVIPILMTTGTLSDMANEYARRLGVVIRQEKMGIFPIIKCNINNGNKIYHLPFDQQYKRTIIEPEKGEFYAMTVKEATAAGFRRAFKHIVN